MRLKVTDTKLASVVAIVGAVSLLCATGWVQAAGQEKYGGSGQSQSEGQAAGQEQPGRAAQGQPEKQQDQAAGQEQQSQNLAHQMSREQITELQKKLNEMGYHAGNVDGRWGPETQAAIKNFQRDKQLEVTGELDQKTAEELGVDIEQKQEQQPGAIESLREGFQGDKTQGQTEGSEQGNK